MIGIHHFTQPALIWITRLTHSSAAKFQNFSTLIQEQAIMQI